MTAWPDIVVLRPIWLLALPAVLALAVFSWRRQNRMGDWARMIDPHLMQAMAHMGRVEVPRSRRIEQLPFWAAALICLALTGPAMRGGDAQIFRNLDGVVFVIDVSDSMVTDPGWPGAITVARAALSALGTKPATLIVYAGDSYAASAFTTDRLQLGQTLALLDADTVPDRGSRPALALQRAAETLRTANIIAGDVVLLTDGGGLGPDALEAAKSVADLGGRLSIVQARTAASEEDGGADPALAALADIGSGRLYQVSDANKLVDDLARAGGDRFEQQNFRFLFWSDYGRYLLLLALLPVAALFRRRLS